MKKLLKTFLIGLVLVIGVFLIGPRPEKNDEIIFQASAIGDDLDGYLENSEAGIDDLVSGTEKEIIWVNPTLKNQTDLAIVYVHGFSATKQEIRPVPDRVAKELGANLYFTRLAGHGRSGDALATATTGAWANDYAEAMEIARRLGKKVVVISTSTGSTLSVWAASKPGLHDNVVGLVSLSANFEARGLPTSVGNMPWAETLLPLIGGSERKWEAMNPEQDKFWTNRYPSRAIFPMFAYLEIVEAVDKSTIMTPVFFIFSPNDEVINSEAIEAVAEEWGGPAKILKIDRSADPSNHIIAGDIVAPENTDMVTREITDWIRALKL